MNYLFAIMARAEPTPELSSLETFYIISGFFVGMIAILLFVIWFIGKVMGDDGIEKEINDSISAIDDDNEAPLFHLIPLDDDP